MHFDAFLLHSFGGPNQESEIIPFLENVTRGRNVPRDRLEKVAGQYQLFGGKSPINAINHEIIKRLAAAFETRGIELPIYFGNRNFQPFTVEALRHMKADGRKRAISFVTSAYGSFSGCKQYKLDVEQARLSIGSGAPEVQKIRHYYSHPGFINPLVDSTIDAMNKLPGNSPMELIFTAHSIPRSMADTSPYLGQLNRAVELVVSGIRNKLGVALPYSLVFQSRSGPPSQQWLSPDISDHLETLASRGVDTGVIVPIGFVSDHMEVIYDLDTVALNRAAELGMTVLRAKTSSDSPEFIEMIVDLTLEILDPSSHPRASEDLASLDGCYEGCCSEKA